MEEADRAGLERFCVQRVGSMFTVFFCTGPVVDLPGAQRSDRGRYARFFHAMLDHGVYLPPSPLESAFVSTAVRDPDLAVLRRAARAGFTAAAGRAG